MIGMAEILDCYAANNWDQNHLHNRPRDASIVHLNGGYSNSLLAETPTSITVPELRHVSRRRGIGDSPRFDGHQARVTWLNTCRDGAGFGGAWTPVD